MAETSGPKVGAGADGAHSHDPQLEGAMPSSLRPARHHHSRPGNAESTLDRVTTDIAPGMMRIEIPDRLSAGYERWIIATLHSDEARENVGPVDILGLDDAAEPLVLVYEGGIRVSHQGGRALYGPRSGQYIIIDAPIHTDGHIAAMVMDELMSSVIANGIGSSSSAPGFSLRPVSPADLPDLVQRAHSHYRDEPSYRDTGGDTPKVLECDGCLTVQDPDPINFVEKVKQFLTFPEDTP